MAHKKKISAKDVFIQDFKEYIEEIGGETTNRHCATHLGVSKISELQDDKFGYKAKATRKSLKEKIDKENNEYFFGADSIHLDSEQN